MLRSLWSGVNGMQAHQIALDIESNNIANVNTTGFKYSRASFVDMLSQVKLIATAPYKNGLAGQNDFSVGLGVGVDATTKIFSQGNLQNTDVKTDLAIEGDGFFVISPDRGVTRNFTRSGEFLFDANGSLVTTGGMWCKAGCAILRIWVLRIAKPICLKLITQNPYKISALIRVW